MKTPGGLAKGKSSQKRPGRDPFRLDIFLDLIVRFGITKFLILCVLYLFLKDGSLEQHREFIDKFILLKTRPGDNKYQFYVIIAVIFVFIDQTIYYRAVFRLKDARIRELEQQIKMFENK